MKKGSRVILWILSIFLLISGLVYIPHVTCLFMLLAGVVMLPIDKWQVLIQKAFPKKWLKPVIAITLVIVAIVTVPDGNNFSSGSASSDTAVYGTETLAPCISPISEEVTALQSVPASLEPNLPSDSSFAIHFIDVGQGDSALVLCDGQAMLIDGGNSEDSNLIYAYLKKQGIDYLDYMVCTHAHEDHVGGLPGALNYATVGVAYCPVTSYDSDAFSNFVKYLDKQGVNITVPKAGDTFSLGSASVTVLGPINPSDEPNNTSIVLRIVYGETSFLFTGDAERDEEQDILDAGVNLSSTVLKVGHHGSSTSSTYPFLREIMPQYAIISVGVGNSYGHPDEDTLSRLRDADVQVFRTDMQGDIICTSDGKTVSFSVSKNADTDTLEEVGENSLHSTEPTPAPTIVVVPTPVPAAGTDYIANTNTKKFHYPGCSSVDQMKESNKWYFTGTRDELIEQGYVPCKNCNP